MEWQCTWIVQKDHMANPGPPGLSSAYIYYHINTVLVDLGTDGYIVESHTTAIPQWSLPAVWENKLFLFGH